jgi:hypothetical protein
MAPMSPSAAGYAAAQRSDVRISRYAVTVLFSLAVLVFVIVGAVVAARRPRNPIGWILIAEGLLRQAMPVLAGQ